MVFKGAIKAKRRAYITFLSREKQIPVLEILRKCNISRATIYPVIREDYSGENKSAQANLGGRPRKLNLRDERKILRILHTLKKEEGNFHHNE